MTYYLQAVSGQMEILHMREPIPDVIARTGVDPAVKEKLIFIQDILKFAREELILPNHGSYRTYVQLERNYVVWNIFAAPELSLEPQQWCYLFVGCLSYRGYFDESKARLAAKRLKDEGWDVYAGGVSAYSTLGWFHDPVLNTMLDREKWEIAQLVFHELAHQKIYINNDVEFNESFADSLARIGLMLWLEEQPVPEKEHILAALSHEDEFVNLIILYRDKLLQLYASALDDDAKRQKKSHLLEELQNHYKILRRGWGNDDRYDAWISNGVNNAKLAAISTYRNLVPYFINLFNVSGQDLPAFYDLVAALDQCSKEQRQKILMQYPYMDINCL